MLIGQRIFGVGLNKTGTTTLKHCLLELGYVPATAASSGPTQHAIEQSLLQNYEPALRLAERYRVLEDRPWNVGDMYRRLDRRFPDSLFVLTTRPKESWFASVHRWLTVSKGNHRKLQERYRAHFGVDPLDGEAMKRVLGTYESAVKEHFTGTGRLLTIDFTAGEGWPELCAFLNVDTPAGTLPHRNQQAYGLSDRKRNIKRKLSSMRKRLARRLTPDRGPTASTCPVCATRRPRAESEAISHLLPVQMQAPPSELRGWKAAHVTAVAATLGDQVPMKRGQLDSLEIASLCVALGPSSDTSAGPHRTLTLESSSQLDHRPRMINLALEAAPTGEHHAVFRLDEPAVPLPSDLRAQIDTVLSDRWLGPVLDAARSRILGWAARATQQHLLELFPYAIAGGATKLFAAVVGSKVPFGARGWVRSRYRDCATCYWPANSATELALEVERWAQPLVGLASQAPLTPASLTSVSDRNGWEILASHGFAPSTHLATSSNGLYEWQRNDLLLEADVEAHLRGLGLVAAETAPEAICQ